MPTPEVLREVNRATRPHGVASADDLRLSDRQIERCCATGVLIWKHSGVFVNPAVPRSPRQDLAAAVAAGGRSAAAWGRSAAALWGLVEDFPAVPEIVVPRRRVARLRGVAVHRSTDLCPDHVTVRDGIRVTKPLITVLDLGVVLSPDDVGEAIVRGTTKRLFRLAGVSATLARLAKSGRTGVRSVRAAVSFLAGLECPLESVLEYRFALLAARFMLPPMAVQHRVVLRGRNYRIDFAYPEVMLAIEVDGFEKHLDRAAAAEHLRRQNALVLAGWTVLRFDWSRVKNHPHEVAAEILSVLGALGHHFGG